MFRKHLTSLLALSTFIISLTVYLITLEPTISFWDCSEFITCAYNLEVGHAPGAPVFMLLGRLAGLFAGNNGENVALMINALSATMSALTVMFLFLTLLWFLKKIAAKKESETNSAQLLVLGSAFIGAMAYAFSDSFWFSAVEGEVYATSSMFSALVFWCITKFDSAKSGWTEYKWVVLIFFLLGFSVGVHLLNILAFPAMALVFYFKKFKPNTKGILLSLIISLMIMVLFIFGIIPGVAKIAAFTDLFFVNRLRLPVYSGALFFVILLTSALILAYRNSYKHYNFYKKIVVLCFSFWLIGYSAFSVLIIRSSQNPFVDINNVENIFGLVDYLNREQYPSRPLFYGNVYNSPVVESKERFTYKLYDGSYHRDQLNPEYVFDENTQMPFPRMASTEQRHKQAYKNWVKIKGRKVKVMKNDGSQELITIPTFGENLQFFFKYQLNYMYWRYFMWNFAGKQNDIQGYGGKLNGNWISGISYFDKARLGDQEKLPDFYKTHTAKNKYYMLPFLVGLLGFIYHWKSDKNNFWVGASLFFFSGIAIVIYLNEVPITPRERDYVHVGSFYVFAIWIGLGTFALLEKLSCIKQAKAVKLLGLLAIAALVPANMLYQNWDDHNRSNRYTARDYAKNMLTSCQENAILFTTADNDTYPIWYLQEVEKYRSDVRQILLTFLPIDWYGNQLHNDYDKRGAIPVSFQGTDLLMSKNQYFPVVNKVDSFADLAQTMAFVASSDSRTKVRAGDGSALNFLPATKLSLKVDKQQVLKTTPYLAGNESLIPDEIKFNIDKQYLSRDELLILDILAQNKWERPVYFLYPHLIEELGLSEYLHREGMLYRLLPYKNTSTHSFSKKLAIHNYKIIENQFNWGNVNDPDVYLDHTNITIISSFRFRQIFTQVANQLIEANEQNKAIEILDLAQQLFPAGKVPFDYFMPDLLKAYYKAGEIEKANTLSQKIFDYNQLLIVFNTQQSEKNKPSAYNMHYYQIQELLRLTKMYNEELYVKFVTQLNDSLINS